jgi:hypothetical protein
MILLLTPLMWITLQFTPTRANTILLEVNNVDWTTDVEPGDTDVTLAISMSNLSNQTISSITGILTLKYPFYDHLDGDSNASALGIASSTYINVSQYKVFGGEPFSFLFSLDINPDAEIGNYSANLEVTCYFVNSTSGWEGETSSHQVRLIIPNREPVINAYYPSTAFVTLNVNETIDFSVQSIDPDNQSLTFQWILDNVIVSTGMNFTFTGLESNLGFNDLEVTVKDPLNMTDVNVWTINVIREYDTSLKMESQYVYAGYNNLLSFNLTNTVWKGSVDISLNVPDGIVIKGEESWKETNLTPGDTISLNTTIYAPLTFLGQVGGFSLTIDYTDYLGNNQVENIIQGVIIRGKVDIVTYDHTTHFSSLTKKLTFSANLLNKGTVSAFFVNVSLNEKEDLLLTLDSSSYLGELEKNDPVPFTVTAFLDRDPVEGENITVRAILYWTDDMQEEFSFDISFTLTIEGIITTGVVTSNDETNLFLGSVFTLAVLTVVGTTIYYTRKKK